MGDLKIKPEWVERAKAAKACSVPPPGTPVSSLSQSQLVWAEDNQILSQADLEAAGITVPLWCLSGSGYGYGSGYGSGYGYGYGDGSGDGSGDGYGSGSGDGDGYGEEIQ